MRIERVCTEACVGVVAPHRLSALAAHRPADYEVSARSVALIPAVQASGIVRSASTHRALAVVPRFTMVRGYDRLLNMRVRMHLMRNLSQCPVGGCTAYN